MQNKLFLISGPSGSGKTKAMRQIMENEVVSFTTRKPRAGEVDGVDYHFIDMDTFANLLVNDGLVESIAYGYENYGITKSEIETKLAKGNAFAIVTLEGKEQLEELWGNTASIFVFTTVDEAEGRMRSRGDSEETIANRISTFREELSKMGYYDYVVENPDGQFEQTVADIREIIAVEE